MMEQLENMEQKLNCEENWKKLSIYNGSMQVSGSYVSNFLDTYIN